MATVGLVSFLFIIRQFSRFRLSRDIYNADGRLYMYAGTELTGKIISILKDLQDLETLTTNIWIATK